MERIVVRSTEKTALYLGQSASIDRGLHIGIGVSLYAANDAEDAPHHPNDGLVASER